MTRHWSTSAAPSSRLVNSKWSRSLRACGNGLGDAVHFCDRIRWGDVARIDARHASGDRRLQLVDVGPGVRCGVYLGCWGNSGRWSCNCPGGSDHIVAPRTRSRATAGLALVARGPRAAAYLVRGGISTRSCAPNGGAGVSRGDRVRPCLIPICWIDAADPVSAA